MKVSLIIPVWNVERYVSDCIMSVMNQTYRDVEVIIVDDRGTDRSIEVIESLLAGYDGGDISFNIIRHSENLGLSAARNTGIRAAKGEYIMFMDSDDTISPNCIELLLSLLEKDKEIQMSVGRTEVIGQEWKMLDLADGIHSSDIQKLYFDGKFSVVVWNKLYRTSFLKDNSLYFVEGLFHEDEVFSFMVSCHLKKMAVTNETTYFYLRREGSLDHIPDLKFHNYQWARVLAAEANYSLNVMEYYTDKQVFDYVEKLRYFKYKEALKIDESKRSAWMAYLCIRDNSYWTFAQMKKMHCSLGCYVRYMHRILPKRLGFWYYNTFLSVFGY